MGTTKQIPAAGARVAHVSLDDPEGGAKAGVVEEYVGDEDSGMVIIKSADGHSEGYDRREVVPLVGIKGLGDGPVMLYPRHLKALLKRPAGILSILAAVVLSAGLIAHSILAPAMNATAVSIALVIASGCLLYVTRRRYSRAAVNEQ